MNTEQTPKSPRLSNRELAHRIRSGTSTPSVLSALYEAVARLIEDKPDDDSGEVTEPTPCFPQETELQSKWPRIRDLPKDERRSFSQWLAGQTRPMIQGAPMDEQDGYYQHDYNRWKAGLPVID